MKYMKLTAGLLPVMAIVLCISCNKSKQPVDGKMAADNKSVVVAGKIAYVEIDTISSHYEMAKDMRISLDIQSKKLDADLNGKFKSLQSSALDFQGKVQKGLVTQAGAQEIQQQLSSQEQGLYQLRDQYRSQLAEDAQVNQRKIFSAVMEYLKEYNKTKGFQYILANQFPSSILYADSTLNITKEVIVGLNAKYKVEKGKSK